MTRNCATRSFGLLLGLVAILAVGVVPSAADVPDDTKLCDNASNDLDGAIQACTRLLESGRTGINITNVLNARGLIWLRKREHDRAIRDFDETINRDPKNGSAYRFRGIAWFEKGELDRAIVDYNKAIDIDPTPAAAASAYKLRGVALTGKGEFERAIADFDRSIKLDAQSFSTYKYRGEAWLRKRDYDRALADFNHAIRLASKDPDRYIDRAHAWLNKGDFKKAVADYDEAIRLNPKNWRAYSGRGEARRLQGEYDRALADHEEVIRLDPKASDGYNNRALVYRDKGDFDAAIADYDEAILLNPNDARAYGNRGEIWRLKNDIARSLKDLDKAISLVPKSALFRCRRGDTLSEIGETDRALADFNEAVLISPSSICAYTGRGLVFEKMNEFVRAKTDFEKALALSVQKDPDVDSGKTSQETARARLPVVASLIKPVAPTAPPTLAAVPPVDPGVRMALVIGNSAYRTSTALVNPRNDAQAVADTFRRLGFKSVRLELDLDREKLTNALRSFARESAQADWAIVYYAGHGIEVSGTNYLIPVDAKLETDRDVEFETVPLERVMTAVDGAKKLRIVILDACRDNPFVRTMTRSLGDRTRSIGRGLAKVEPDSGSLIVYSAKAGQVASDGKGDSKNSPFATALIKNLLKPGLEIRRLFDLVRDDVMKETKRAQQPFTYGSVPGAEDFYFVTR